jgi:hypothetical protein
MTPDSAPPPATPEQPDENLRIKWLNKSTHDWYSTLFWPILDLDMEHVVQGLIAAVKATGNCIMVGSYEYKDRPVTLEHRMISAVQLGDPMLHIGLVLGNVVGFMAIIGDHVEIVQIPTDFCPWEMRILPVEDVELAVRIAVDTLRKCCLNGVKYNCHTLENVEHMLSRLLNIHEECDSGTEFDYDFDEPSTWRRGVHCSQLVLLTLKRFVLRGALKIGDEGRRREFMSVYSHTCTPGALSRLMERTWPIQHLQIDFTYTESYLPKREGFYTKYLPTYVDAQPVPQDTKA